MATKKEQLTINGWKKGKPDYYLGSRKVSKEEAETASKTQQVGFFVVACYGKRRK